MEELYLLYESNYGELLCECDSTDIIGLYKEYSKAVEKAKEYIEENIECNNYILDKERNNIEEDSYVRLFYDHQENWNDYFEIIIKKVEVK